MRSSYPATVSLYKAQALLHSRAWSIFRFARVCVISPKGVELSAPGHHVWVGENVTARTPLFCVVLKDGEYWQVEAEWPDGTIEEVYRFNSGLDALNWVKTQSAAGRTNVGRSVQYASLNDLSDIPSNLCGQHWKWSLSSFTTALE